MTKCTQCNKEFEAKRADAKFCSSACKMRFNRNKSVTDNPVTDNSVTDNVTDKSNVTFRAKELKGDELLKYIETHTIKELEKEGMWIPNWKRSGTKSQQRALLDLLEQMLQRDHGRFLFLGREFE